MIRRKLDVARGFVDPAASDAEVVEFALEEFIQSHQEALKAEAKAERIAGEDFTPMPPAPDFDLDDFIVDGESAHS